ncbi:MAG TPA: hydrogenase maturation protease [Gaiellaceae bacterium]|nr:hydrogenase maturation protease [Gaiellaceae bacterium]
MSPRTVVIGVGNPLRGDDAAGVAVAERLRDRVPPGVEVVACAEEPSRLMEAWGDAETVVLVDTVASGAPPGTLHRFEAGDAPVPARAFRSSTHAIGLAETIELARALGRLPKRVLVYGIEGGGFATGEGLSPPVEDAVVAAAGIVLAGLEEERCTSAP